MDTLVDARRFLSRIRVWGGPEFTGIHYTKPNPRGGKPFWNGTPVRNVDDAIRKLAWMLHQPDVRDIYVALGTQRATETRSTADGKTFEVAKRGKENTVSFRTLFMDLDVKEGAYASTEEAATALSAFVQRSGLPRANMAVASGTGGLHVYWVLDRNIPADEWHWMGLALANAGLEFGLKFDSQCSYDYARILRIPDTFNRKTDTPLRVRLVVDRDYDISVEEMAEALEPFRSLTLATPVVTSRHPDDELGAGLETTVAPRDIMDVAQQCAWVWDSLDNGGRDNNDALRLLAYNLAMFCQDTDNVAWRMVCNRVTLGKDDPDEFENKLQRVKNAHASNTNIGFPRCSTIAAAGAMQCRDCPLKDKIPSPLSFSHGIAPIPQAPEDKAWYVPQGYILGENDLFYEEEIDEEQGTVMRGELVLPKPVRQPWLAVVDGEWVLQFLTTKGESEPYHVTIKLSETASKDTLNKALRQKALISIGMTNKVFDFVTSFIALLQSAKKGIVDTKPFGWQSGVDGGFAFAGKNYNRDGVQPAPNPGEGYEMYGVAGSPEPWREAALAITSQGRPALDVILASSFAAPLVHLAGGDIEGFVIGAVSSQSGVGKTTTLNIAQAVWAKPISAKLGLSDTINSIFGKAGNLRHLPLLFDEIKGERETKAFIQLLFQLTGGKEKNRMSRSTTVREAKTWSTLLTYGSNSSLTDALLSQTGDTVAGNMRLFEFTVPPITADIRNTNISRVVGELTENYGHAGATFSAFIGHRQRELRDRLATMREEWMEATEADDSERFWVAACACILLGAELANTAGLTSFNLAALRQFLFTEHKRMQDELSNAQNDLNNIENLAALLGDFLASKAVEYTVITNRIHESRGAPVKGSIRVIGEGTSRMNRIRAVHVHIGVENRLIRISDTELGVWAHNRGMNKTSFIKALCTHFGAKETKHRLGAGVGDWLADNTSRAVIELRAAGTPLDQYLGGVLELNAED